MRSIQLACLLAGLIGHLPNGRGEDLDASGSPSARIDVARTQIRPRVANGRASWEYTLVISERWLRLIDGTRYRVWAFGGTTPGPTLIAREGDWVRIRIVNETSTAHSLHSHGLWVPHRMDGAPHPHEGEHDPSHLPRWASPVPPGESYTYEYIARPAGTHFYHCHANTNEHLDRGMSGAFVVLPRVEEPRVDQDWVLLLDEWSRKYAGEGTPGHPRDLFDYDTFTINGKSFPETEIIRARLGDIVRIRFINGGALPHSMHLHGHEFLVTHKDGQPLAEPALMDTVSVAPGERVDIVVLANNPGEWPMHCHSAPHITNAGRYPGGMMIHFLVGNEPMPRVGHGPVMGGVRSVRESWRRSAARILALPEIRTRD